MAGLFDSFKQAFNSGQKPKPADDTSSVVIDDPEQGFVVVPASFAQEHGIPALLGIKPSQVPKDESKRLSMTALYRKRKAERIEREKAQEARRSKADAELAERNKPYLEQQAARAAESMRQPEPAPASPLPANVSRALGGVDSLVAKPAPSPAVPPPVQQDPEIEVSPVGQMAAPSLPRALPPPSAPAPVAPKPAPSIAPMLTRGMDDSVAPPSLASIPAPILKSFAQQRLPDDTPDIPAPMALSALRAATPAASQPQPTQEEPEDIRAAPAMFAMPAASEAPKAAPTRDFAALSAPAPMTPPEAEWAPPSPRVTDDDRAALLAMAKGQGGSPLRAPAGAMGGDSMGTLTAPIAQPAAMQGGDLDARDAEALRALAAAQRRDNISTGLSALGNQFEIARDLFLQRTPRPTQSFGGGEAVAQEQARQALLNSQRTARRNDLLADATVAAKKRDAAKDEATLAALQEKQRKTAADVATNAALNDPASPESARIRETVTQLLGQRVDASTLEKLSGSELKDIALKYGVSLTNAEQTAGLRAIQIQQTGEDADRAAAIRRMGLDIQLQELDLAKKRLQQQEDEFNRSLADKGQARDDALKAKQQEHDAKLAERNVGGFKFKPEDPPSADAAKKMADVSLAAANAKRGIARLRELYAKHGTELTGPVSGEMGAEWKAATDQLRNIGNMGVPNGKDYEMLALELPNPTEASDLGRSKARVLSILDTVTQRMDATVDATAYTYKYQRDGGRTTPSASLPKGPDGNPTLDGGANAKPRTPTSSEAKSTKPQPGQVKIRDTVNNAYYIAPAKRAAELIKKDPKKWQEVERG